MGDGVVGMIGTIGIRRPAGIELIFTVLVKGPGGLRRWCSERNTLDRIGNDDAIGLIGQADLAIGIQGVAAQEIPLPPVVLLVHRHRVLTLTVGDGVGGVARSVRMRRPAGVKVVLSRGGNGLWPGKYSAAIAGIVELVVALVVTTDRRRGRPAAHGAASAIVYYHGIRLLSGVVVLIMLAVVATDGGGTRPRAAHAEGRIAVINNHAGTVRGRVEVVGTDKTAHLAGGFPSALHGDACCRFVIDNSRQCCLAGAHQRQELTVEIDVFALNGATGIALGHQLPGLVVMKHRGLAVGRFDDALTLAVVGVAGQHAGTLLHLDQAVVLAIGKAEGIELGGIAGIVVAATAGIGAADAEQSMALRVVAVAVSTAGAALTLPIAHAVVAVGERPIITATAGQPIQSVVVQGLIAVGIDQVSEASQLIKRVITEVQVLRTATLQRVDAPIQIETHATA